MLAVAWAIGMVAEGVGYWIWMSCRRQRNWVGLLGVPFAKRSLVVCLYVCIQNV